MHGDMRSVCMLTETSVQLLTRPQANVIVEKVPSSLWTTDYPPGFEKIMMPSKQRSFEHPSIWAVRVIKFAQRKKAISMLWQ